MNVGIALGNLGFAMANPMAPEDHAELCCRLAEEAERLGFHSVWVGDHVALPLEPTTPYPYGTGALLNARVALLDPFAVHAAVAGRTSKVGLGFGVVVLPYRPALVTAKLVATIDALSRGRVILGVGAGWLPEEFAAVDADFATRASTTDAYLRCLLRAFEDGVVDGMTVLPTTVQRPHPPIWVGGNGPKAMRRAVELADGWDAPYADPGQLGPSIATLHQLCDEVNRDPTTLGLSVRGIMCDVVDADLLANYEHLGVTEIGVMLPVGDPPRAFDALAELATVDGTTRDSGRPPFMTDDTPVPNLPADRHERADVMFQRVMGTAPPAQSRESFTHDHVFGDLWSRPNLDIRTRRVVSMVCAAMVGADLSLRSHLTAALRTGEMTIDELREVGLQLGHYGGAPLGVNFSVALQAAEASLAQPS